MEQWLECGKFIRHAEQSLMFWMGDWLNYGEEAYGEKYSQALESKDFVYGTLRNAAYVARKVPLIRRRPELSFSHHHFVAALDPKDQIIMLDEAVRNKLSCDELLILIKRYSHYLLHQDTGKPFECNHVWRCRLCGQVEREKLLKDKTIPDSKKPKG